MAVDRLRLRSRMFDRKRARAEGKDAQLILLREDGESAPFTQEFAVETGGWCSEFSEFFGNTTFNVADITDEFAAAVKKATHLVVINSGMATLNDLIHETLAETAPPAGDKPWWRIRAKPVGRKYVATEEI